MIDVEEREIVRSRRVLEQRTSRGDLFIGRDPMRCVACAHRCLLADGREGSCGVRIRRGDDLLVPFGYVARQNVRDVETNTIFHVEPGTLALTFGMYGCDLRCPYCHNHALSQALRDADPGAPGSLSVEPTSPAALVQRAIDAGCRVVCAAYNEPMIAAEWVRAVFARAKAEGLVTAIISDGNSTPEALAYVRPVTDVFSVDLKAPTEAAYRAIGGRLAVVLDTIRQAWRLGFWVEVVTLVVPGLNDHPDQLRAMGDCVLSVDASIPWHLNALQPRHRLKHLPPFPTGPLFSAAGTAYAHGSRFVYVGNVPADVPLGNTFCRCGAQLVSRRDYRAERVSVVDGRCPECGAEVPGVFGGRVRRQE